MSVPTFHSDRLGGHLHLGRLPATPLPASVVRWADLRASVIKAGVTLPKVPKTWKDFTEDFSDWGMKGNGPQDDNAYPSDWAAAEGAGDCTIAGSGNEVQEDNDNSGRAVPKIGTKTCISQYTLLTKEANGQGYDPETGSGDTGLNVQQVNEYRQKTGFLDDAGKRHFIVDSIALEPGNYEEYVEAVYLFTKVGLGVLVQQAQMDQFNAGEAWDWVKGQEPEGGHYIPGMNRLKFVTWTKSTAMTINYYENAVEEAYGHISAESFKAVTGKDATGYDQSQLEEYAVLLAKQKAGQ